MKLELLGIVLAVLAAGAGDARMPAKVGVAGAEASQLEGRVPGNAVSCLPLFTLGSSDASDGRIVFHGSSSRTLHVNVPKSGSDLLNDDVYLVVRTPSSSLCRSDIVLGCRSSVAIRTRAR